jgi:hypothetical protein
MKLSRYLLAKSNQDSSFLPKSTTPWKKQNLREKKNCLLCKFAHGIYVSMRFDIPKIKKMAKESESYSYLNNFFECSKANFIDISETFFFK